MKAFIVNINSSTVEDNTFIHLFGRLENGQSFLTLNEFKPYFYIKKKDLENIVKIIGEIK